MKCPRCVQDVDAGAARCGHCGFSLAHLDSHFGEDCVVLERLTDAADCLRGRDREKVVEAMDDFEKRFPQLFVAVYIGILPEETSIRQFGFWLLNRAAVPSVEFTRPNTNGALIVLDLNAKAVGLTLGYFLEPFVSDSALNGVLRKGHPHLVAAEYDEALVKIIQSLTKSLRKGSRQFGRKPTDADSGPVLQQGDAAPTDADSISNLTHGDAVPEQ